MFKYRVKGRSHEAPMLTVGRFIRLQLVFQDLAGAGTDPRLVHRAHQELIDLLENPKVLRKIPYAKLRTLASAWARAELGAAESGPSSDGLDLQPELFSREQLELNVHRTARILGKPFEAMLEMQVADFNRLSSTAEALWAGLRLDLIAAIDHPHLTDKGRAKVRKELTRPFDRLKPANASPWRDHFERARRLLRSTPRHDALTQTPARERDGTTGQSSGRK